MAVINTNDNSIFDKDGLKETFLLEAVNENTVFSYKRIFKYTSKHEFALDKDIRLFTFSELETVLFNFKSNNRNTVETYARIISSYLNWCVKHGKIKENVLASLKPKDFEKYLTNEEVYITEKTLRRYEDRCVNPQDSVILRLSFVGVGGKQMSEIRNLRISDVDFENKRLHLLNTLKEDKNGLPVKFTERFLDVDDRTLELIKNAYEQKIYLKKNGDMIAQDNIKKTNDLVNSHYIVRASITKTHKSINAPVDKFVVYRRMKNIAEALQFDKLTAKYIQRSGMMYYANELIKGENELSLDDIKIVADRFNMKSYHNLKGFLDLEHIRQTYPQ
ncbi:site-specific tyrosine recombinase [Bacillus phage vB_BanS-Thrax3]|nr:site-specific tyrosine recombinase [Bacillus phage vB_BanS-Thrax3]